jgi:hypothetical protein
MFRLLRNVFEKVVLFIKFSLIPTSNGRFSQSVQLHGVVTAEDIRS